MIGLMIVLLTLFWIVSMVLVLWGVDGILWNGHGTSGQDYVVSLQESEISAEYHYKGLILGI